MHIIDDDYEEAIEAPKEPTNKQINDLKKLIKTTVRSAGGKIDLCDLIRTCQSTMPSIFSDGFVEQKCIEYHQECVVKKELKKIKKDGYQRDGYSL